MNRKRLFLLIGFVALVVMGGFYYTKSKQGIVVEQSGNQVYKNSYYGFEFTYPADYKLEDYKNSDSLVTVSKKLVSTYPSLTGFYISVYSDADVMYYVTGNNIICQIKKESVPFGAGKMAKEYACGDAGTTERRYLMLAGPTNTGLMVSVTTDAPESQTPAEYKEIPGEIINQILASFVFTK